MSKEIERLTAIEEDTMNIIWQLGTCNIRQVLAEVPEPKPPYTTLASVFKNLERKHYIKPFREGKTYHYRICISREEYATRTMHRMVDNYFTGSYKHLVQFFAAGSDISVKDLREVIDMIEKGEESE
ncbi:transcriptional regulator [Porphyromonas gingivalis SJD2]|uniref:BlaI/MecI/CopY family transcriptional regulator n=1 Tax=Porphyromonas gingivalis TaxID=837 RepID=UPI0003D1BDEE|nr:BlaI/MecI/CopY family transcriptional regulator [Porphyromonas gingivalis]ETA26045.1 transcriptional regulator [Porphyromonas gingivalis SJD2]OWR77120.1 transcriptional regulator [Porphyromonas gingivalis SJD5]PDP84082.1 transcriptional regulator [Porphyromonas gingivalis]